MRMSTKYALEEEVLVLTNAPSDTETVGEKEGGSEEILQEGDLNAPLLYDEDALDAIEVAQESLVSLMLSMRGIDSKHQLTLTERSLALEAFDNSVRSLGLSHKCFAPLCVQEITASQFSVATEGIVGNIWDKAMDILEDMKVKIGHVWTKTETYSQEISDKATHLLGRLNDTESNVPSSTTMSVVEANRLQVHGNVSPKSIMDSLKELVPIATTLKSATKAYITACVKAIVVAYDELQGFLSKIWSTLASVQNTITEFISYLIMAMGVLFLNPIIFLVGLGYFAGTWVNKAIQNAIVRCLHYVSRIFPDEGLGSFRTKLQVEVDRILRKSVKAIGDSLKPYVKVLDDTSFPGDVKISASETGKGIEFSTKNSSMYTGSDSTKVPSKAEMKEILNSVKSISKEFISVYGAFDTIMDDLVTESISLIRGLDFSMVAVRYFSRHISNLVYSQITNVFIYQRYLIKTSRAALVYCNHSMKYYN